MVASSRRIYLSPMRPRTFAAAVAASTLVTVLVATLPVLHFAYRAPALHVALETAASLIALLATFLVFGRLRRRARLNELVLAAAFVLLTLSSVLFALLAAFPRSSLQQGGDWGAGIGSMLALVLLAAAAVAPRRPFQPRRHLGALTTLGIAVLAALAGLSALLSSTPLSATVTVTPRSTAFPDFHAPAAVLPLHVIAAVAGAVAALGFMRRSARQGDPFFTWLALGATLAAFSRINYALYPTRYTDWVYVGDGFRLAFYLVLLLGGMSEISSYWRSMSELAVLEERRRIARDLHDGLAQEIAYLGRNLRAAGPLEGDRLERLRRAADRAELESRRAVGVLSTPPGEPLEVVLARAVEEVADRFGADLDLDLASGVHVSPARTECLLRIACEAVGNAARHSGERRIALDLERVGAGVRLRIADGGRGFDPAGPTDGFGLVSMRERARSVGGLLRIDSAPGRGTTVEVAL